MKVRPLVALQATQTKLAQPIASSTPLPTVNTSAIQTLQSIQATQTAMSLRPTATPTTDTLMTQTLAAIAATQTAMSVRPTATPTTDISVTQTMIAIAAMQTAVSIPPVATTTNSQASVSPTTDILPPQRPQTVQNFGTGPFSKALTSDGMANIDYSLHLRVTRVRREENQNGCGMSDYNAQQIWFAGSVGTSLSVNGSLVGKLTRATGSHGIIINFVVNAGDTLCASGYNSDGFLIFLGPDLYWNYDSYCTRVKCT